MDLVATMSRDEAKAVLRSRLRNWPHVDDQTERFLSVLPWQLRQVVQQQYGLGLTQCRVACRLGISERSVRDYLASAADEFAELVSGSADVAGPA